MVRQRLGAVAAQSVASRGRRAENDELGGADSASVFFAQGIMLERFTQPTVLRSGYIRRLLVAAFLVTVAAASSATFVIVGYSGEPESTSPGKVEKLGESGSDGSGKPAAGMHAMSYAERLVSMGWHRDSAEVVAQFNSEYFANLKDGEPSILDRTIKSLGRLGNKPLIQRQLIHEPELAGLLADALEVDEDAPQRILDTLSNSNDADVLIPLYELHAAPNDCAKLARTLERDGDVIARLLRKGAWDAVAWFYVLPKMPKARAEYRRWLRELFDDALRSVDEDALDRAQTLLTFHARVIRKKLEESARFREDFVSELWPMFKKVLDDQIRKDQGRGNDSETGWGVYVQEPRVWTLLDRERQKGWQLFASHGSLAVDLLLDPFYEDCRQTVIEALEQNDLSTIDALYDENLRREPLFKKLLKRDLPGGTLAKALFLLRGDPADAPRKLRYWDSLGDAALIEELGPPPDGIKTWLPGYSLYYLTKKYAQGREVTGMDIIMAAVEAAEFVIVAKGTDKAVKTIGQSVKKDMAKRIGEEAAEEGFQKASAYTARGFAPWVLRKGHRTLRVALKKLSSQLDITEMVKFAYRKSGAGRETFKRISRLEARVFMRGDRRIIFDLPTLASRGHPVGRYLRETALAAGVDTTLKTSAGKTGLETGLRAGSEIAKYSRESLEAWRKHISAWWLANAADSF